MGLKTQDLWFPPYPLLHTLLSENPILSGCLTNHMLLYPNFFTLAGNLPRRSLSSQSLGGFSLILESKNMTLGPILIMKAPGCKRPVKVKTIGSGNTFGSIAWTDGRCVAPMLPDNPWLRKSPSEGVLFWLDECKEIGQIDRYGGRAGKPEWEELDYAEEPSEADYLAAINSGIANTKKKLRYVRTRLWWTGNDRLRRNEDETSALPGVHVQNLLELAALLSNKDAEQRLMKAEIFRELSRFDDALKLLEGEFPDGYEHAVRRIRDLAASGNSRVAEL